MLHPAPTSPVVPPPADEQRVRRIGFGEVTRTQTLIDRTLAEVAGTLLTAELALAHGLACNTAGGGWQACSRWGSVVSCSPTRTLSPTLPACPPPCAGTHHAFRDYGSGGRAGLWLLPAMLP